MKEKAAFEELTKELRDLVVMTILCYCKHRSGLRQVRGREMLFNSVVKCANDYGLAEEAYMIAGAVMDGVIALCDAGRVPDFNKETTTNTRRAVALMFQLTYERLDLPRRNGFDVQEILIRFKNLEDEIRIACFGSFVFGDVEVIIQSLREYTRT